MSDKPMCRDCADFGPICPNSGKPCALAHTGQAAPAGEVASELQSTAPTRIYLDIGDQFALDGILAGTIDWQAEGVTWSQDNATSHGVAYVREDLATPATEPAAPGYVSEEAHSALPDAGAVDVQSTELAVVRSILSRMDRRGGLGLDVHEWIRDALDSLDIIDRAAASTVQGKEKP